MNASRARQIVFGALAVVGLVVTWYFNLTYSGSANYLQAWFANSASSSAAVDLIIVSVAASIFIVVEARRLRIRFGPAFIVLGVVGAMACAVPLFLLFRERALAATRTTNGVPVVHSRREQLHIRGSFRRRHRRMLRTLWRRFMAKMSASPATGGG